MQQLLVVFPPSPEISPTSQGGFLTLEITFLSLTPTPSPAFLPGFSGRFHSPAQSFSGLSTDGKVYSEVTLNMSEGSQPFIHTLPQQLLMSTLLQGVSLRLLSLQVFCLCYLLSQSWFSLPWSSDPLISE